MSPPSLEDIKAAYEGVAPPYIYINDGLARIRDPGSDGDEDRLPLVGEQVEPCDNTIDVLEEADEDTIENWLKKIGNYLIHEGDWHSLSRDRVYCLKKLPKGYRLYTHKTGDRINPRKDSYLYGSTTDHCKVFRSPEEFVLHAKWLIFGQPKDGLGRPLCGCCYCSKTPQREISAYLKTKVSHLQTYTSRPTSGGRGRSRARPHSQDGPIIAKDYTRLNQGEGVLTWSEDRARGRGPSTA